MLTLYIPLKHVDIFKIELIVEGEKLPIKRQNIIWGKNWHFFNAAKAIVSITDHILFIRIYVTW